MTEKLKETQKEEIKDIETDRTLINILKFALEVKEFNDLFDCIFDRF